MATYLITHVCAQKKKKLNENKGKDDPFPFPALAHASSCPKVLLVASFIINQ